MKKLVIIGAKGRMGEAIVRLAEEERFEIAGRLDQENSREDVICALAAGDVCIEFAHPSATSLTTSLAARQSKPLVIGTTGHDASQCAAIAQASIHIPVVYSPNYSVGVNVLFHLVKEAGRLLGDEFDVEVLEAHHRFKKDAPSGTAERLLELLIQARKERGRAQQGSEQPRVQHGRSGAECQRAAHEIGVHSVRAGDMVGEHTVLFGAPGERVELTHRASNRDIFACGALRAAQWVMDQQPGLYDMTDVLGLKK